MKRLLLFNVLLSLIFVFYVNFVAGFPPSPISDEGPYITLTSISSVEDDRVMLEWETRQLGRDWIFMVERSTDGDYFQTICGLRSTSSKSYAFFDKDPIKNKTVQYRIKAVQTGKAESVLFSLPVSFQHSFTRILNSYPNPVADRLYIDIPSAATEKIFIVIKDFFGREVFSESLENEFQRNVPISTRELMKGTYFIQLTSGENRWTTRMQKN